MYDSIGADPFSWAGSTYEEIREVGEQDGSVLIIPVGSVEQHGHHLPVATDTILVDAITTKTGISLTENAEDLPFLIAPTIWSGYSPHHMEFGGTLTAQFTTLLSLVTDVAKAGFENGFDAALLVNGHGGNKSIIAAATSELGDDAPDKHVLSCSYFDLASPFIDEIRESDVGGIGHGGEFETSLMLYLRPDLVREERMNATYRDEPFTHASREMFDSGALSIYRPFASMSDTGELGDPTLATEEKGHQLLMGLVDELTDITQEINNELVEGADS